MFSHVTAWDWFILIVLLHSIGVGLYRGMVRMVFALSAWLVGLVAVPVLAPSILRALPPAVPQPLVYALIFTVFFVTLRLLGMLIARGMRGLGLAGVDRVLGGGVGVIRAVAIVLLAAVIGHLAGLSSHASWTQAASQPLLDWLVRQAEPFLPDRARPAERQT